MLKRLLSIVLTATIILSVFTAFPVSVNAEEATEPTDSAETYSPTEDDSTVTIPTEPVTELESETEPNTERLSANPIATEFSTENNEDSFNTAEIQSKPDLASTGANGETYEQAARYVPNYVITDSNTIQPMYNPYTASMALDMCTIAYRISENDNWANAMIKYGYQQIYRVENDAVYDLGESTNIDNVVEQQYFSAVNATVGLKQVEYNGQIKYAVAIVFRGTNIADVADVLADIRFIQNSNGVHKGFAGNAYDFYQRCKTIYFNLTGSRISLYDMIQDMKNPNSKYCLLVSGHSLGAALADVFVGYSLYNDSVDPSNVVAYTFAAPRSVSSSYYYPYKNIINIINEDDWVPTVGGAKRIGTDFSYTPDDTFRQQNYGDQYEEGHGTAWWSSFVNQSVVGGLFHFVSHKLVPVYKAILIQIENNTNDYTSYHTNGDNIWNTTVLIEKNSYSTINGKATIRELRLTDGRLNVKNDLNVSYLCMTHEDAYLLVENDIVITGSWWLISDDTLNAGTVEVKGDFTVTTSSGYYASGNHTTVFSGDKTQTITFSTPSNGCVFKNLVLRNSDVVFATPIYSLTLSNDITITSDSTLEVNNVLNLNGHTLTTQGDVKAYELQSNGGSLNTQSKLTCTKLASVMGGSSIEALNSDLYELKLADGQVHIKNNLSVPYLHMTHEDAYLLVDNNIRITGNWYMISGEALNSGVLEVKGDFTVTTSSGYYATGNHTTVFSGNKTQTISFSKPSNGARFNKLILSNNSSDGCKFISTINVTMLFDHQRKSFVLYNGGIGSTFVDYDGDGKLDHVDPYPTDPNNTPPFEKKRGDTDGDGEVTIIDATCIQRYLAQYNVLSFDEVTADADGDCEITILDATAIQRYLATFENIHHISEPIE